MVGALGRILRLRRAVALGGRRGADGFAAAGIGKPTVEAGAPAVESIAGGRGRGNRGGGRSGGGGERHHALLVVLPAGGEEVDHGGDDRGGGDEEHRAAATVGRRDRGRLVVRPDLRLFVRGGRERREHRYGGGRRRRDRRDRMDLHGRRRDRLEDRDHRLLLREALVLQRDRDLVEVDLDRQAEVARGEVEDWVSGGLRGGRGFRTGLEEVLRHVLILNQVRRGDMELERLRRRHRLEILKTQHRAEHRLRIGRRGGRGRRFRAEERQVGRRLDHRRRWLGALRRRGERIEQHQQPVQFFEVALVGLLGRGRRPDARKSGGSGGSGELEARRTRGRARLRAPSGSGDGSRWKASARCAGDRSPPRP